MAGWCRDGVMMVSGCGRDDGWRWCRGGVVMVASLRPAFLPSMLAGYFRVGEGHMWEHPKLFWARACMGENF